MSQKVSFIIIKLNKSKFKATKGRKQNRRKQRQMQTKFKSEMTQGIRI